MIYFIFLFRMTDLDDYFGWLFRMTVLDACYRWLFWMIVPDHYFRWLFWMAKVDDFSRWLFWVLISDDFSRWLFLMTVRDPRNDSYFSNQFVFPQPFRISTNYSADWSHDWFVFERRLPTAELWPWSPLTDTLRQTGLKLKKLAVFPGVSYKQLATRKFK